MLAAALLCLGCDSSSDTVFYPLNVAFESATSEAVEGSENVEIAVRLNAPSDLPVSVEYEVVDESASGHDACGTRDYSLASGSLTFEPGQTVQLISLRHLDDDLYEQDEQLRIELTRADGARLGDQRVHRHTIVDDDRELLIDVQADFGARGDGVSDDTKALQAAFDRASISSAAVVLFPPGVYRLSSLELTAGVSVFGYGATLVQAPGASTNAELLSLTYAGDDDSPLTLVQGLSIDGNRDAQGAFTEWQFQESDLFFARANSMRLGRLRLLLEDVAFLNTGGNGLMLDTNTDTTVCQIEGREVFTDVLKLAGGNSRLEAVELTATGTVGTTGVAITGQNPGNGERKNVDVTLDTVELGTGDLEIDVEDGSNVVVRSVTMAEAPFYLRAVRSTVSVSDSDLVIGPPEFRFNRIVAPNDVSFADSRLTLSERVERTVSHPEADRELVLFDVTWDDVDYAYSEEQQDQFIESLTGQSVRFEGCSFLVGDDVEAADTTYVAGSVAATDTSNRIQLENCNVASAFDAVFAPNCGSCEESP